MSTQDDIASAMAEAAAAVEICRDALDTAKAHALFRDAVMNHPGGQAGWARANGFSPAFVNDVLHHRRDISGPIAAAIGLQRRTVFVRTDNTNTTGEAS